MKKYDVILLTGIFRCDNLYHIAKSLMYQYNKIKNYINIYWCICVDQYNKQGSIDDAIDLLNKANIDYYIYNSGKPNQKNYGGDLYNEPLIDLVENKLKLDDTWVYVLDDDNIIHPMLFDFFIRAAINYPNNNCMVLPMLNEHNITREMYISNVAASIYRYKEEDDWVYINYVPDPSCVFLKYSLIKKYNYFMCTALYDMYWLMPIISNNRETCTFYDNLDGFGKDVIYSYHNALRHENEINEFINNDNNYNICDVILCKTNEVSSPILFPILSDEAKKKIMNIVKDEVLSMKNNKK